MKKIYMTPELLITKVQLRNHLLVDSGTQGLTVNFEEEVTGNFVKENRSSYNVWNDDWNQ